MKRHIEKTAYLMLALSGILAGTASCKKGDTYYYDYQNESRAYDGTVLQYLEAQPSVFDSLVLVLDRLPHLRASLNDASRSLTMFAVTNRSFEIAVTAMNNARRLSGRPPLYLEDIARHELDSLVSRYIFTDTYDIAFLSPYEEGQTVESIGFGYEMNLQYNVTNASGLVGGGQQQILFSDVNRSIFQRYWKRVNTASVDLKTRNGIIHVLSPSHDFGFNKLTTKFSQ